MLENHYGLPPSTWVCVVLALHPRCPVEVADAAHHVAEGGLGEGDLALTVALRGQRKLGLKPSGPIRDICEIGLSVHINTQLLNLSWKACSALPSVSVRSCPTKGASLRPADWYTTSTLNGSLPVTWGRGMDV